MSQKNRFKAKRMIVFKKIVYASLIVCSVLFWLLPKIPVGALKSDFYVTSIANTIPAFISPRATFFRLSPYDFLEESILSIKASEVMQKKYAAHYGGIIKAEKNTKKIKESIINGNVLETDLSTNKLTFINTPGVSVDAETLLGAQLDFSVPGKSPQVLIVHTHTSEAYAESPDARNYDEDLNVVAVGRAIKNELTKSGISVIHDTTQNDNPSYNQSYKKTLSVIEKNIAEHPTIQVVLDIHRDYIKRDDNTLVKPTVTTKSGEKSAQIMFVIGTDSMDLYHPDWRHNLAFAAKIQSCLFKSQPGLCRPINIRTERFNQHATKGSMIIEVGTGVNTISEAVLAGKLTGKAIAEVLHSQ